MNKSTKFLVWLIVGVIISVVFAFVVTTLIEYGREHGSYPISVIFTPGRESTENILRILSSAFGVFASMSAGITFFILGLILSKTSKVDKSIKRIVIIAFIAFSLFIIGLFLSLYFIIFSSSTGTATSLDNIYHLIRLFIVGLGFTIITVLSIFKLIRFA